MWRGIQHSMWLLSMKSFPPKILFVVSPASCMLLSSFFCTFLACLTLYMFYPIREGKKKEKMPFPFKGITWKLKTGQLCLHSVSKDSFSGSYLAVKMFGLLKLKWILLLKGRRGTWVLQGVGVGKNWWHEPQAGFMVYWFSSSVVSTLSFWTFLPSAMCQFSLMPVPLTVPRKPEMIQFPRYSGAKKGYSFTRILYLVWFNLPQKSFRLTRSNAHWWIHKKNQSTITI